jgi:protoporphyrinogen oxidase
MGLVALYLQKTKNWEKLESKTASEFMLKWAGKRNYEVIWGPLLEGKFTIYKDQVAMPWLWSKFATRVASRDKGLKEKLGYISGSWGVLIDELEQRILEMGGEVHVSTSVERILVQDNKVFGLTIQEKGTKSRDLSLDMVIATVPSFTLPNLVELPEEYVSKLRGVNYEGAIAVIFVLKHRLSNIYWLNVMDPTIPFLLVLEQTNLVPPEQYGGKHIIYTANYVTADDYRWNMDARDIVNEYLPYLKRINPEFDESWIEDYYVHKEPAAQPIVTVNYRNKMPDVKTPVEGLWLASMSQVYPQDRGTNYSLKLAVEVARKAIETVE